MEHIRIWFAGDAPVEYQKRLSVPSGMIAEVPFDMVRKVGRKRVQEVFGGGKDGVKFAGRDVFVYSWDPFASPMLPPSTLNSEFPPRMSRRTDEDEAGRNTEKG